MATTPPISDAEDAANRLLDIEQKLEKFQKAINADFKSFFAGKKELYELEKKRDTQERALAKYLAETGAALDDSTRTMLEGQIAANTTLIQQQREAIKNTNKLKLVYNEISGKSMVMLGAFTTKFVADLAEADKASRQLNLSMGFTGKMAETMRDAMIDTAPYAASLGVSFKDLAEAQEAYTSELGSAVILNAQNLKSIVQMGKGTKMGTAEASKMAGKFNLIGKSVQGVNKFYEEAINQSVRFGVSASQVISKINENLEKSQQYVFKGGTAGLAKMAVYATKFKMDMTSVFGAMDKANTLEGAVDMASQLQVIGGNFARQDPFKLLYQARNDANGFTESMQNMTKGMATFNKQSGEFDINAGDLNRLKLAADATGMSYESLITQAKKGSQIDMMKNMTAGLTDDAKDFIAGIAEIQKDGSFRVTLPNGEVKDIRSLGETAVRTMMMQNKTLDQRAKEALSFDELFLNTINQFKAMLLPVLQVIQPITNWLSESGVAKWAIGLGMLGIGLIGAAGLILKSVAILKGTGALLGGKSPVSPTTAPAPTPLTGGASSAEGMTRMGAAAKSAVGPILAVGAAILMIGGGIYLATKGIASMADAFKQLNVEQMNGVNSALNTLGLILGGAAVALTIFAATATVTTGPLLGFGAAVGLIGLGIGVASLGIAYAVKGLGDMFHSISEVSDEKVVNGISSLVWSLSALGASSLLFANPLAWAGLAILTSSVGGLAEKVSLLNFSGLVSVGTSFDKIASAINSIEMEKLDKLIAVSEGMSSMGSLATMFASLNNMFGDGIEVKFKEQEIDVAINITNEIDGSQLGRDMTRRITTAIESSRRGGSN